MRVKWCKWGKFVGFKDGRGEWQRGRCREGLGRVLRAWGRRPANISHQETAVSWILSFLCTYIQKLRSMSNFSCNSAIITVMIPRMVAERAPLHSFIWKEKYSSVFSVIWFLFLFSHLFQILLLLLIKDSSLAPQVNKLLHLLLLIFRGAIQKIFWANLGFCPNEGGGVSPIPTFYQNCPKLNLPWNCP